MAKVTSSSNRSKRSTKKPVTKGQNPQRANRQSVSQARVSSAEARKPSPRGAGINQGKGAGRGRVTGTLGRPKPATPAKVTTGAGPTPTRQPRAITNGNSPAMRQIRAKAVQARRQAQGKPVATKGKAVTLPNSARAGQNLPRQGAQQMRTIGDSGQVRAAAKRGQEIRKAAQAARGAKQAMGRMSGALKAARTLRNVASAARLAGPVGAAAAVLAPRKLADATMKGKPTGNPQGPAVPKRLTQGGLDKGSFDSAFKASRSAGKKTFTWRGKKYNTKLRGE